jgi:hypothetical protein
MYALRYAKHANSDKTMVASTPCTVALQARGGAPVHWPRQLCLQGTSGVPPHQSHSRLPRHRAAPPARPPLQDTTISERHESVGGPSGSTHSFATFIVPCATSRPGRAAELVSMAAGSTPRVQGYVGA